MGWSLRPEAYDTARKIEDSLLVQALALAQDKFKDLVENNPSIAALVGVGTRLISTIAALKTGVWVQASDSSSTPGSSVASAASTVDLAAASRDRGSLEDARQVYLTQLVILSRVEVGEEGVLTFQESIPVTLQRSRSTAMSSIVAQAAQFQQELSTASMNNYLGPHVVYFLHATAECLRNEALAAQLEHLAKKTLIATRITGRAGELVLPSVGGSVGGSAAAAAFAAVEDESEADNGSVSLASLLLSSTTAGDKVIAQWDALIVRCAQTHPYVTAHCFSLQRACQAARVLKHVLSCHIHGDLSGLVRSVDLLVYLAEIDPQSHFQKEQAHHDQQTKLTSADTEKLQSLKEMDAQLSCTEEEFSALFSVAPAPDAPSWPTYPNELPPTVARRGSDTRKRYVDQEHQDEKAPLLKTLQQLLSAVSKGGATELCGWCTVPLPLRDEAALSLELLRKHAVFELLYADFVKAVRRAPARGAQGELSVDRVEYAGLAEVLQKAQQEQVQEKVWIWGMGGMVSEAAQCLHSIRIGQKSNDDAAISSGLQGAKKVLEAERAYTVIADCVLLGGKRKRLLSTAASEVELAELDLQQRSIMHAMTAALATPGIPLSDFPFDLSAIQLQALEDAHEKCDSVVPACAAAQHLYHATSVVLTLRRHVTARDWTRTGEYLEELGLTDPEAAPEATFDPEQLPGVAQELRAARRVMAVSLAVELAERSYHTGYLSGFVGTVNVLAAGQQC